MKTTALRCPRSESTPVMSVPLPGRKRSPFVYLLAPSFLALIFISLTAAVCCAQELHSTQSQVEAAYLYKFGKFVRWQNTRLADSDVRAICIMGKDPFGAVLDSTVAGETIDGKRITVNRLAKLQDPSDCSILFVGSSEESRLGAIVTAGQRLGILTVSNIPHFAERGGIIEFVVQQGRIRFIVNRNAAEASNLSLSSELLKVAIKVIDRNAPQGQP